MELKKLPYRFSVCKVSDIAAVDLQKDFYFIGRTDEELSLVCRTEDVPEHIAARDDGWRGFRIQGVLDFSLIGILSKLSAILAEHKIGIFAVSTYNTDYILVKEADFERALRALADKGYTVTDCEHSTQTERGGEHARYMEPVARLQEVQRGMSELLYVLPR